jgi:hypothetical protein
MNFVRKFNNLNENNIEALICSNSTHKNSGIIDGKNHYLCMERKKEFPINEINFVKIEEIQINNNDNIIGNLSRRGNNELENLNRIE